MKYQTLNFCVFPVIAVAVAVSFARALLASAGAIAFFVCLAAAFGAYVGLLKW